MGKTKPFINKKQSVTFYLTHNDGGSSDSGDEGQGDARADGDFPAAGTSGMQSGGYDGDNGSVVEGSLWDDSGYTMTAEKRKEMLLMGLPDDGYDYLRHLKAIATGGDNATVERHDTGLSGAAGQFPALNKVAEQEEAESSDDAETVCSDAASKSVTQTGHRHGPVMFIHAANVLRAAADVQLVDARQLSVPYTADDEEVDAQAATVSAFARPTLPPNRGRLLQEIRELEESMVERETGPGQEAVENVVEGDEHGDWLDLFVVEATQGEDPIRSRQNSHYQHSERDSLDSDEGGGFSEDAEDERPNTSGAARSHGPGSVAGGRAMSIASSYWRPERSDRKMGLKGVDDSFEIVAAEYDDDVVGDLDEDATAVGAHEMSAYESVLDDFLRESGAATSSAEPAGASSRAKQHQSCSHAGDDDLDDLDGEEGAEEGEGEEAAGGLRIRGSRYNNHGSRSSQKVESLEHPDAQVIAITKARALHAEQVAEEGGAAAREAEAQQLATLFVADPEPAEKWDVESVLSMRSNVEHHPSRIVEPQRKAGSKGGLIKLSSKSGLPSTVSIPNAALNSMLGGSRVGAGLEAISEHVDTPSSPQHQQQSHTQRSPEDHEEAAAELEEFNDDLTDDMLNLLLSRQKNETAEDKKVRKATVKAMQRASRVAKKETKELFKSEELKQNRQQAGKGSNVTTFVIP